MKKLPILLISLIVASCSIPVTYSFFNNSGSVQLVVIEDKSIQIKDGKSEYIKGAEYVEFSVSSEKAGHTYSVQGVPLSKIIWRGWGPFSKRVFYVQLEPDGKVWATDSKDRVEKFSEQPEGFPLAPNT
ncbi:hypothetical protein [Microbulbifer pacificus]|uniref:Lipoprotein n=1 Tax=Microbulbifer pacificus TaxID=407164 RepID=A0AAU0MXM9_9GAMM|nr:hypothetical protein [Microbulbifer pacificus]WOX04505.1 hypothetical protein R5R33_12225 [Microbulbifer pacificus]